jgi:universal stress protein A
MGGELLRTAPLAVNFGRRSLWKGKSSMATRKILYATDYSAASLHALQFAAWLAHSLGAPLLIVHVSEFEQYPVGELFTEPPDPDSQELARLQSVRPADATIAVEHHLLYGEPGSAKNTKPAEVIVQFAKTQNVAMIVLGTHGRSGLLHLLMGTVAESVMRRANCPVVTVRQAKESPDQES